MSSPTPPADVAALFEPLTLGPITLPNKIIMSALTRARSVPTNIPNELNVEYYTQRAKGGAGLIVSEGVPVVLQGCVSDILYSMHSLVNRTIFRTEWPNAPGIWSDEQVEGWKKVVQAFHQNGSYIYAQLWHSECPTTQSAWRMYS